MTTPASQPNASQPLRPQFHTTLPPVAKPLSDHSPAPLDYATPASRRARELQLEQLMLAGDLAGLRKMFRRTKDAAAYYVDFITERYSFARVDGLCKSCGRRTPHIVSITWQTHFPLNAAEFSVSSNGYSVRFTTSQSLCGDCYGEMLLRRSRWWRVMWTMAVFSLMGVALLICASCEPPWMESLKERWGNFVMVAPALLMLLSIVIGCIRAGRIMVHPPALLRIVPGAIMVKIVPAPSIEVAETQIDAPIVTVPRHGDPIP